MARNFSRLALLCALAAPAARAYAADAPPEPKPLLEMGDDVDKHVTLTSAQVSVVKGQEPGMNVTITPGEEGYPGFNIVPAEPWDLSKYGHIEVHVVNTGTKTLNFNLRVDNGGDWKKSPWNAEGIFVKPGADGTVKTIFGYSYGHKPAYPLKSNAIIRLMIFTGKSKEVQTFHIDSILAAGPAGEAPPVAPGSIRITPQNGFLMGGGLAFDPATQVSGKTVTATAVGTGMDAAVKLTLAAGGEPQAALKPATGKWDLRDCLEVKVKLRNDGTGPVTPKVRLDSSGGPTEWTTASAPLAPGTETELVVPFMAAVPLNLSLKKGGTTFVSDAVSAVQLGAPKADAEQVLTVKSVVADMPPTPKLPDWLGKRPPVEGDWTQTFNDDFTGDVLNADLWDIYGPNYWDSKTHWSKEDVWLSDGVAHLKYEKKTGTQNDDPKGKETDYQAGFLHTYGKWAQRYGYFESRMKLPRSPGLWPAFWMMPERGGDGAPQWKRQDTKFGGMEFDIMEHLTRWGPNRYNIAMHWDGYTKEHKSNGSPAIYFQPDKDGYLTTGLLWTPGSVVYYCNGQEVLRWENPRVADVPEMMMYTLPMGGWDNDALDDKKLPAEFQVDYVRSWQRKDLASDADGKVPGKPAFVSPTVAAAAAAAVAAKAAAPVAP